MQQKSAYDAAAVEIRDGVNLIKQGNINDPSMKYSANDLIFLSIFNSGTESRKNPRKSITTYIENKNTIDQSNKDSPKVYVTGFVHL